MRVWLTGVVAVFILSLAAGMAAAVGGLFDRSDDLRAMLTVRRILKRVRPDTLHCHSSKAGGVGRLAAIGLRGPAEDNLAEVLRMLDTHDEALGRAMAELLEGKK